MAKNPLRPIASLVRYGRQHGLGATVTRVREWLADDRQLYSADRKVFERTILPHYAGGDRYRRVLFVGCERYTQQYAALFKGKDYWTIEPDDRKRPFGSEQHHIVAGLERLGEFAPPGTFDAILCNGVFGWGLDRPEQSEAAVDACWSRLAPGGEFVVGWNDVPEHAPVPLHTIPSMAKFEPLVFAPLGVARYPVPNTPLRHVFDFYRRPTD